MISRNIVAGERIGACAGLGHFLEGIAVGHIKHLMLQIVGHAVGRRIVLPVQPEAGVHGTVIGGKERIAPCKAPLGYAL